MAENGSTERRLEARSVGNRVHLDAGVLDETGEGFAIEFRISAVEARALAASLLQAADEVQGRPAQEIGPGDAWREGP